jgi:hypothetical protein
MKKIKIFIVLLSLFSCKNIYEEGPMVSLRSEFARITGRWHLVAMEGTERIHPEIEQYIELTREECYDGDGYYVANFENFQAFNDSVLYTCGGCWSFKGTTDWEGSGETLDSEEGLFLFVENSEIITWKILRLTNKELIILSPKLLPSGIVRKLTFLKVEQL